MSHEYDGEGGIIDWADELAANGVKSPGNWKDPKLAHKKVMNALLQMRAHLIFCLRADEKIEIIREGGKTQVRPLRFGLALPNPVAIADHGLQTLALDEKIEIIREGGKTQVRPLGWMPICEKRFMFEMTASFTLTPDRPGFPQYHLPHKVQEQHRAMFPEGEPIGERAGEALRAWAAGGAPPPPATTTDNTQARVDAMLDEIAEAADMQALFGVIDRTLKAREWLKAKRPDLHQQVHDALKARHDRLADAEVPA